MTSYDGQTITYDAIGNPLTYRDGLSFTWANGRELAGVTNGTKTGTYTYNDSGIRTSKTYDGSTTNYYLNGSSIVRQDTGSKILDFFYDENGNLYGFKEAGAMYYYVRNGQSDIIGILDSTGLLIASYVYDSWGNLVNKNDIVLGTVAYDNPFRYRGYYFDLETGLYYLNSRYYDSTVGRFINVDGLVSASSTLLGTNMYAYCENNPVNYQDSTGFFLEGLVNFTNNLSRGISQVITTVEACLFAQISFVALGGAIGVGLITGAVTVDEVNQDLKNLNFFNTSEDMVLDSHIVSFYKGIPVIRQDLFDGSMSFGAIFLDKDILGKEVARKTVKHEYGHNVQLAQMMPVAYLVGIGIPSLTFSIYDTIRNDTTEYFKRPWEAYADFYGGVDR
jgi:RHS repeat-associated protein